MELDPHAVSGRVLMKGASDSSSAGGSGGVSDLGVVLRSLRVRKLDM